MGQRPRIAIAGFQHETNTFAPMGTAFSAFMDGGGWPGLTRGAAVGDVFRGLNIPLGGFIAVAEADADLVPILWTSAEPAAEVERDAFEQIMEMILHGISEAGAIDGIYLDLHGAMVTQDHFDGEAQILGRVRALVDELPIAVSLDLHANLSAEVVELADVITIYRTYPHLDMAETGARAWRLLQDILKTGKRSAKAFRQVPDLIPLSAQCTEFGPVARLYKDVVERSADVTSADAALGFPLSDVPMAGPAVVAYASDQATADQCVEHLATQLSKAACQAGNTLWHPADAIRTAAELTSEGGTVVLADVQDNSGAGAMADSTGLLAELVESGLPDCLLGALWDPETVKAARAAGAGATLAVTLGGKSGPHGVAPFECTAIVVALSDGRFTCTGEMQRGVETDIGPSALLKITQGSADVTVLVTSLRHQAIDQDAFRHIGAEPSDFRIVGVKSTVHFRADFSPIAKAVLMVDAPGYSICQLDRLDYKNRSPARFSVD